jgi:exportin-1
LGPIPNNVLYIQEYVASLLKSAFGHLTDNQIKVFVTGLFNLDHDVAAFKEHLRDFIIQIRVSNFNSYLLKLKMSFNL